MNRMFQALWANYKTNKSPISATYWYDEFNAPKAFNSFVKHLSKSGWITTTVEPKRNWAEIHLNDAKLDKYVTPSEILSMRQYSKFTKYILGSEVKETHNLTKTSKGVKDVGLIRKGQTKASSNMFKFDTAMLFKYFDEIVLEVTKGIRALELDYGIFADNVDYESISTQIVEHHLYSPDTEFCLGGHISDSRGRAVSKALSKVFNPIGFKVARALLLIEPKPLGLGNHSEVYLAISELLGYKPSTVEDKIAMGEAAYARRAFHTLDLTTEEGRKDLYENIWLERLYDMMDNYDGTNWTVPIEIDATASVLQIEGTLLGHAPFLDMTNVIGDTLKDAWTFQDMPRAQFKAATTPLLYGSSQDCRTLWKAKKLQYSLGQVKAYNKELAYGPLAVADKFKDFIINNVKPKEEMQVTIWGETFSINCNRFRTVGDYTKRYDIYCSKSDTVKTIYHTHTHKEADLGQFRRYFVTLLVHNIDSRIADNIAMELDWVIPIYDAFIVHPGDAMKVRTIYANNLDKLYADREEVLTKYFSSIGIDSKASTDWSELQTHIIPVQNFKAQLTALK